MTVIGILLAAGQGRRFDPSGLLNKLLQPMPDGDPVVVASAKKMLAVLPRVVAVVRAGDVGVAAALVAVGCEVTLCAHAERGMAVSLAHGVAHCAAASGWLLALGDMPHVQAATLRQLLAALEQGADIVAPLYAGRRGHPVGFSRLHMAQLLTLDGDQGARSILRDYPVHEISVADQGILQDIDTRADL